MKPERREVIFEKVKVGDFVEGVIGDIQYEQKHRFLFQGKETITPAVRFIFVLKGYQYKHYSSWMSFSYGEKSRLYQRYLLALVENAKPEMDFDLDLLKGMQVKTIWQEKNNFQDVMVIFPLKEGGKISASNIHPSSEPSFEDEPPIDEEF